VTFEAEDGAVGVEEVMLTGEDRASMIESDWYILSVRDGKDD
jgi:hypothetical protein